MLAWNDAGSVLETTAFAITPNLVIADNVASICPAPIAIAALAFA